jgi:hypothetical protein
VELQSRDLASKFAVFSVVSVACFDIVRDLFLFVMIFGNIDIEWDFFSILEKFAVFFEAGMGSSLMLAIELLRFLVWGGTFP